MQYARCMTTLTYSDGYDRHDVVHQSVAVPRILLFLKRHPPARPLFPFLKRLVIDFSQPGWVEDLLPYISSPSLQFLSIKYNARKYSHPKRILVFISYLIEGIPSLRTMKLKLRGSFEPYTDLFAQSQNHSKLRHLNLDCPTLLASSFSRVAQFPSLRQLTIRLKQRLPPLPEHSIALPWLEILELRVSETKFAISFFGCIENLPKAACIFISIEQIIPFKHELEQVSCQISRLCSSMFFRTLDVSFHDFGAHHTGLPPLMPEDPGYTFQALLPLVTSFSLQVFCLSVQLPLLHPSSNCMARVANSWADLTSITIDPGYLIPLNGLSAVCFCDLLPFFQVCKRLRRLYIHFQHSLSNDLPFGTQATQLYDLGLGYIPSRSKEILVLARWLQVAMPALPAITLVNRSGDRKSYNIDELTEDSVDDETAHEEV